ncbi:hypothetical protein IJI17_02970 [Candidatus Saccharibacteria bacterium]|nr:hypothetical protein [Candidatus Saccharibacteria bacterium]
MINNKAISERVEVMALFGYEMTPCQPLSFKRRGEAEVEVTELVRTHIRFVGTAAHHIFDIIAGHRRYALEFNSTDLSWHLTSA